jgi:CBS domain-containing protein
MKRIREMLEQKGTETWSVGPSTRVFDAIALMAEKNVGAVLVLDDGRLVGILSERDCTRHLALRSDAMHNTQVGEIMMSRPVCVGPEQTIEDCMALMTDKRVRHLPVVEGDRLLGVVSIGDAVKATISEQQFVIEQLERYISG